MAQAGVQAATAAAAAPPARKDPTQLLDAMVDVVLTLDELENRIENFTEERPLFSQM